MLETDCVLVAAIRSLSHTSDVHFAERTSQMSTASSCPNRKHLANRKARQRFRTESCLIQRNQKTSHLTGHVPFFILLCSIPMGRPIPSAPGNPVSLPPRNHQLRDVHPGSGGSGGVWKRLEAPVCAFLPVLSKQNE